ncbi:hypothetical protein Tco_1326388 [Tanacetum coccineum]
MGRGTWYYSLGVSSIVDAFVRVDVRTYLLGGAIDGSKENGIIHDPKLELESSRFTFDLVPLSYESVDVVVGENWSLRHKAMKVYHEKVVKMPWSCKVRVGSNGNLLWEASVLLGRKKVAREDDRGITKGREDVREVFQQHGSGAKTNLSRVGRNQMGNEPVLALPKGADDFVVLMKDYMTNVVGGLNMRHSRWMKLFSEYGFEVKYHAGEEM